MNSFSKEFYYGNLEPQARSTKQNPKVQRDMRTFADNEDFLIDRLEG